MPTDPRRVVASDTFFTLNELCQSRSVAHATFLERLKGSEVKSILKLLAGVEKDLLDEFGRRIVNIGEGAKGLDATLSNKRLARLLKSNADILRSGFGSSFRELRKSLDELAAFEARFSVSMADDVTRRLLGPFKFIPHKFTNFKDVAARTRTVWVDVAKLDAEWSKTASTYIPPGGGANEIKVRRRGDPKGAPKVSRRELFGEFMTTGKPIQQSAIGAEGGRFLGFDDGRHRFTVFRDMGHKTVPMSVEFTGKGSIDAQAADFKRRFGASDALVSQAQGSSILGVSFTEPAPATLRSIVRSRPFNGRFLRDWWRGIEVGTRQRVNGAIKTGLVRGDSVPRMARAIRSELMTTRRQAEAIVRTSTNHVVSHAREETYRSGEDVLKGAQWVATLDGRTTVICASLDGKVFNVGEGPRPPAHMSCRSTTTPVLKSWEELGIPGLKEAPASTRAALGGPVSEKLKFPEWLRGQPASVQNRVLGSGGAELWRQGKVSIDSFVDANLKPLSLAEVIAREGLAA